MNNNRINDIDIEVCCTTPTEKKALAQYYKYCQENGNSTELETKLNELIDGVMYKKYGNNITDDLNEDINSIEGLNEITGFIKGYIYAIEQLKAVLLVWLITGITTADN